MEQDMDVPMDKIHQKLQESFASVRKQYHKHAHRVEKNEETDHDDDEDDDTIKRSTSANVVETVMSSSDPTNKDGDRMENQSKVDSSLSIFDSCSEYIITGKELTGNLLNLSSHHMHVLTRPTILEDERYERNSLLFCVGFVLRRAEDPRLFRPILSKWALSLRDLELETRYLSTRSTRIQLQYQLDRMLLSLNSDTRECYLQLSSAHVLSLRLFHPPRPPPEPVEDHDVPVLLRRDWQFQMVRLLFLGQKR